MSVTEMERISAVNLPAVNRSSSNVRFPLLSLIVPVCFPPTTFCPVHAIADRDVSTLNSSATDKVNAQIVNTKVKDSEAKVILFFITVGIYAKHTQTCLLLQNAATSVPLKLGRC